MSTLSKGINMTISRKIFFVFIMMSSSMSFANCFGSNSMYSCNDLNGNSYNVQKFGGITNMQGSNANTGSQWNQTSQTLGNSTFINGSSNGRSWNETIQSSPGMTTYSGTDSSGRSYTKICTAAGCF